MAKKMFRIRGRSGLMLKVFRLLRGVGKGDFSVPSSASTHKDLRQPKSFNPQAYIIAKNRMHEIEGQKAMIIRMSRHDSWKAGGPV